MAGPAEGEAAAYPPFPVPPLPERVERVLDLVERIPVGRVLTYGDVAGLLGSRGARFVGTVLGRYGSDVAWWRVVRAGGWAPRGHEERALARYREEGTPLVGTVPEGVRVDLALARWDAPPACVRAVARSSDPVRGRC